MCCCERIFFIWNWQNTQFQLGMDSDTSKHPRPPPEQVSGAGKFWGKKALLTDVVCRLGTVMLGMVSVYVCVLAWVENKFLELLSEQCGWYRKLLLQIQEGEKNMRREQQTVARCSCSPIQSDHSSQCLAPVVATVSWTQAGLAGEH